MAREAPDGYTLIVAGGSETTSVGAHRELPYDPHKDFTSIIRFTAEAEYIVVPANSPYQTIEDFVKAAKAEPGKFSHGSAGVASLVHSAAILLQRRTGIKLKHVPYQGGAPAVQALVAGQIDITIGTGPEVSGQVEAKKPARHRLVLGQAFAGLSGRPDPERAWHRCRPLQHEGLRRPRQHAAPYPELSARPLQKGDVEQAWQDYEKTANEGSGYLDGPGFQKAQVDLLDQISEALKQN